MTMKKLSCCLFTLALTAGVLAAGTGCGPAVAGSGNLETQELDYSGFTKVNVGYAFQVEITRADSFSVSITLDDNLFQYLEVEKSGSTVHISLKTNRTYLRTTQRATITMPDLRGLELSGASRGDVSGFTSTDSLRFEVSGASSVSINNMEAGDTQFNISGASKASGNIKIADGDFDVSGASTVELEGTADDVTIAASGASSANLEDFPVVNATLDVSGASNATINASGRLDANISGASTLYYIGNPTLGDINVSGASKVSQKIRGLG